MVPRNKTSQFLLAAAVGFALVRCSPIASNLPKVQSLPTGTPSQSESRPESHASTPASIPAQSQNLRTVVQNPVITTDFDANRDWSDLESNDLQILTLSEDTHPADFHLLLTQGRTEYRGTLNQSQVLNYGVWVVELKTAKPSERSVSKRPSKASAQISYATTPASIELTLVHSEPFDVHQVARLTLLASQREGVITRALAESGVAVAEENSAPAAQPAKNIAPEIYPAEEPN